METSINSKTPATTNTQHKIKLTIQGKSILPYRQKIFRNSKWADWEDNIKMELQQVGGGRGDWMELAQDRDRWRALVDTCEKLSSSINMGNFLTSFKVYC
jgi:hypothetical protein